MSQARTFRRAERLRSCKRAQARITVCRNRGREREGRISGNSGAYGRLSTETTAAVCDEVLAELNKRNAPVAELGRPLMLLYGSSLSVEHSAGLLDAFPAGRNQRQQAYDRLLICIGRAKLPKRSKTRASPRAVWSSGKYYLGRQADGTLLQSE